MGKSEFKRIGILGGTFNPIHTGHLLVAEGVKEELGLDYVLFIPCYLPPHKKPLKLAPARHRLAMVRLAIRGNPSFRISTIEIKRKGKSYSVDTLEELHRLYKGKARFFFIIGSDSISGLRTWKSIDKLMKLCKLVAVSRPGYRLRYPGVKIIDIPTLPISSTDIRRLIKEGKSIRYLVPEEVRRYIVNKLLISLPAGRQGGENQIHRYSQAGRKAGR